KVQEEIDAVVGSGRAPSTEDKLRMPYTNAVIHELQRFHKTRIENFPRMATQDVLFRGYTIPKGTPVIPVLSSVHSDPTQWENPKKVDPAHFLDEKGEFRKREAFMAFSAGQHCPTLPAPCPGVPARAPSGTTVPMAACPPCCPLVPPSLVPREEDVPGGGAGPH
ncbi:hypothetical protein EK904_003578, partial [Melospiza melodia maxima]